MPTARAKAIITPRSTESQDVSAASAIAAICVLSPSSPRAMR